MTRMKNFEKNNA